MGLPERPIILARFLSSILRALAHRGVAVVLLAMSASLGWAQAPGAHVPLVAQPAWRAPPVKLAPGLVDLPLGAHLEVLQDPDGQAALSEVRGAGGWRPLGRHTLSAGFARGAWWLRVRLHNTTALPAHVLLDAGTPLQDVLTLWQLDAQGKVLRVDQAGDRLAQARWPQRGRTPVFPVTVPPGGQQALYVKLTALDGLFEAVTPVLRSPPGQVSHVQRESLVFGSYFGMLAALLLYNLFLYASTRDRSFLYYVLHLGAFGAWSLTFRGYAFQYLWPDQPGFNSRWLCSAISASFATAGLFQLHYTRLRQWSPRLHKALVAAVAVNAAAMLLPWGLGLSIAFVAASLLGVGMMALASLCTLRVLRQGSRPALYVVLAFAVLCVGVSLYYLRVLGVLAPGPATEYGLEVGSALQMLLLALGVADQMNTLKAQKIEADREALAAQTALASRLDVLVTQRTRELEEANRRLGELSVTDELTGAFNRRHFNELFAAEVARHVRQGAPLIFCLFDVDFFKAYNDRYGHPAGDEVLRQVARAVHGRLKRRGDHLFRVGGEEFAVLLSAQHAADTVPGFVDGLRLAIADLGLRHEGSPMGVVTASFGLVLLEPQAAPQERGLGPEQLYALADERLYEAKRGGRNRVVLG